MGLFKGKKKAKTVAAAPPEEEETKEELEQMEEDEEDEVPPIKPKKTSPTRSPPQLTSPEYREVPVCLSQAQVNTLVIENNIMLKQIIAELD